MRDDLFNMKGMDHGYEGEFQKFKINPYTSLYILYCIHRFEEDTACICLGSLNKVLLIMPFSFIHVHVCTFYTD